jgi:threonine aldolase
MPAPALTPALRARCSRSLSGQTRPGARAWVERLAASPLLSLPPDDYSVGPALQQLEEETAALLGKEAALFFPKGIMAQQAALLVHAERRGHSAVALHPRSHLAVDESDALQRLSRLQPVRVGPDHRPFTLAELQGVREPLGAVTVELPLRRAGFVATPWEELQALSAWAREHQIPFHLDGARLWEVQPWYGRSLAELAALADTVYVSFYKGLGGLGGAVLAGPRALLDEARPWRERFGGSLYTAFPFAVLALEGLRERLPRMGAYYARACELALALRAVPGLRLYPEAPHCNSFQVLFDAPAPALIRAAVELAETRGTWLFPRFADTGVPGWSFAELVVADPALEWSVVEAVEAVSGLLARAARP